VGTSLVAFLSFAIFSAYFTDWVGLTISPAATLVASVVLSTALSVWLSRQASAGWLDLLVFTAIVTAVLAWLLWFEWPDLLVPGGGADLTHHLQLVDYIDRHWRLVHDPPVEAYLGEMVHYTPGAHLLASLAGRWAGADGFHALYPVLAFSVALKTGFVYLIARRVIDGDRLGEPLSIPFAILAPVLLLLPYEYFVGSFTRYSYIAQAVSECFAVAAWWAVVAWDDRPSARALAIFGIAGAASFLTWPVFVGALVAALAAVVVLKDAAPISAKLKTIAGASIPVLFVALAHAIGRLGWAKIVRTDANIAPPGWNDFTWPFLILSVCGLAIAARRRRGRATALVLAAIAAQAGVLYVLAKTNGAVVPYMAVKMGYLVIYPLAVCAALAMAVVWQSVADRIAPGRIGIIGAWAALAVFCFFLGRSTLRVHVQKPTVSESLYQAGRWAREHAPDPSCIDYIVGDNHTAYWLHLAVTGNRRMSARTADDRTYDTRDEILRWIQAEGLPYAVADLATVPKDVLDENDELARFGSAVVIKRRGASACAP
jgi:hypothetical protein